MVSHITELGISTKGKPGKIIARVVTAIRKLEPVKAQLRMVKSSAELELGRRLREMRREFV